jgi:hypothetical protein
MGSSLAAVDPAREAYLRQFRDADPTDRFYTPASPEYTPAPPGAPVLTVEQAAAQFGTSGFGRDAQNNLTYTNRTNDDVALLFGFDPAIEPQGIRVVRPGAIVTVPGGARIIASAQAPQAYPSSPYVNFIAVGGSTATAGCGTGARPAASPERIPFGYAPDHD